MCLFQLSVFDCIIHSNAQFTRRILRINNTTFFYVHVYPISRMEDRRTRQYRVRRQSSTLCQLETHNFEWNGNFIANASIAVDATITKIWKKYLFISRSGYEPVNSTTALCVIASKWKSVYLINNFSYIYAILNASDWILLAAARIINDVKDHAKMNGTKRRKKTRLIDFRRMICFFFFNFVQFSSVRFVYWSITLHRNLRQFLSGGE